MHTGMTGEANQGPLPAQIKIVQGDATQPVGQGPKIIAHICNDEGRWGRGFVVALSSRWTSPERRYRSWHHGYNGALLPLGDVQLVEVDTQLWVANMIAQRGVRTTNGRPPIRYDSLDGCLRAVATHALVREASVHMPRIGCGLAGGQWERVEPLIRTALCNRGVAVTVYDPPATDRRTRSEVTS